MRISVTFYLACFCYFVSYAQTYYGSDAERKIPNTNVIHYNGQSTPAYIKIRPGYNIPQQSAIEWLKNTLQLSLLIILHFLKLRKMNSDVIYSKQAKKLYTCTKTQKPDGSGEVDVCLLPRANDCPVLNASCSSSHSKVRYISVCQ
jgi:hypothetical protein